MKEKTNQKKDKKTQTIEQLIRDERDVNQSEEYSQRPKRKRKEISYKALEESIDYLVNDFEIKQEFGGYPQEVNDFDKTITNENSLNPNNNYFPLNNDLNDNEINNSDEDFESRSEELINSDIDYNIEEVDEKDEEWEGKTSKRKIKTKINKSKPKEIILKMTSSELKERVAKNECFDVIDENEDMIKSIGFFG